MVKFGILGCGRIAMRNVAALSRCPTVEIAAIASERPGVAESMAKQLGIPKAYFGYKTLLLDPEIEAVYIASTGESHCRLAVEAAEVRKHVLCEKSLATSVDEAERMVGAAKAQGVLLQEAFMWRHHPRTKWAVSLISRGEIGVVRQINAHFSFLLSPEDWRNDPSRGGGVGWDLGCYGVNAARLFAGNEPTSIIARARYNALGADTSLNISLAFPNDILALVDCSFETPFRNEVEIVGTQGRLVLPFAFSSEATEAWLKVGGEKFAGPTVIPFPKSDHYEDQAKDFCESIRQGRLLAPAETGLENMRVLEAALKSARAH